MNLNIIHTYRTKYTTVYQPPGFADFVMGTMFLYNVIENPEHLFIDYSEHPINNFLINYNNYPDITKINKHFVFEKFNEEPQEIINTLNSFNEDTLFTTNCRKYILNENLKKFIKQSFVPNKVLRDYIISEKNNLQLNQNFNTLHIRMGDFNMHKDVDNFENIFAINNFLKQYNFKNPLFITSDNFSIKRSIQTKFPFVKFLNNKPIHLGDLKYSNINDVKSTLADFFIMAESNNIYTYSVYGGSGFVDLCRDLGDIPLERI
jgi:hypothetical protein